jgi:DNA-binding transcriptional LysR family regulator
VDDLRDLILFVEVAERRSFTAAARHLDVPASTLSRRIAALEKRMGIRLLHRSTRGVDVTDAGALLLQRGRQIADEAVAVRNEVMDLQATPKGRVAVSLNPDFGTGFLAPVVASFCALYPRIDLRLDLTPRRVDLVEEGIDVSFRVGMPHDPTYLARKLIDARRSVFASQGFLDARPPLTDPDDLRALPCLSVGGSEGPVTWVFRRGADRRDVTVEGPVVANTPGMVLHLAAEGVGVAAADEIMAAPLVESGRLVHILADWSIAPVPIYAVTASKLQPLRVRLFIEHVRAALRRFAPAA